MFFKRSQNQSGRIRVLVNGIHAKSGGGVTYIRNLLPLLARDHSIELHFFLHSEQLALFGSIDKNVKIHSLNFPNGFFVTLLWEQFILPIHAKLISVDVTYSPANFGPLFATRTVILLRNSLAVAGDETRLIKRLYWLCLTWMTKLSLIKCERAIAVSNYAKKILTDGMGSRLRHKVPVIYHGVNNAFQPSLNRKREKFLLSVSDIYIQKNIHTLISAFKLVRNKFPEVTLKLAGKAIDRSYLREIQDAIYSAKLEDAVEFLGEKSTDDLIELYQSCALFLFPSTVETFGNPLVEAMACGTPIVSSDRAAMPEILEDAAKFFNPMDAKDMAETILSVMENDEERQKLAALALRRSKFFSWDKTVTETASIFKSLVPTKSMSTDKKNKSHTN